MGWALAVVLPMIQDILWLPCFTTPIALTLLLMVAAQPAADFLGCLVSGELPVAESGNSFGAP